MHFALAAIGFFHRRVPDPQCGARDVRTDAVAFDKPEDRVVGHDQLVVADGDFLSGFREFYVAVVHTLFPCLVVFE